MKTSTPQSRPNRPDRTIALVGLMGAGKSTIGRRLAERLEMEFVDADSEIERAAGLSVPDIFARFGEPEFRRGERQVLQRLVSGPPKVIATGGGAFMDADTRALIRNRAISVWLRADLDVLVERCARRADRPLLKDGDMAETLAQLMSKRYPVYATADFIVDSDGGPHEQVVDVIVKLLSARAARRRTENARRRPKRKSARAR